MDWSPDGGRVSTGGRSVRVFVTAVSRRGHCGQGASNGWTVPHRGRLRHCQRCQHLFFEESDLRPGVERDGLNAGSMSSARLVSSPSAPWAGARVLRPGK